VTAISASWRQSSPYVSMSARHGNALCACCRAAAPASGGGSHGLSAGAIAGIVIGAVAAAAVLVYGRQDYIGKLSVVTSKVQCLLNGSL
jgi:hypothetical protein